MAMTLLERNLNNKKTETFLNKVGKRLGSEQKNAYI